MTELPRECPAAATPGPPAHLARALQAAANARALAERIRRRSSPGSARAIGAAVDAGLPVVASGGRVTRWSIGKLTSLEAELSPSVRRRSSAPIRRAQAGRWRIVKRSLVIGCGMLGGFALGIVTSGGALLIGFNLAHMLDALLLQSPADARPASPPAAQRQMAWRAANPSIGFSSVLAQVQARAAAEPAILRSNQAKSAQAGGMRQRVASGSSHPVEAAPPHPAASAATVTAWDAREHRPPTAGDLAAATHWYREPAKPQHLAILYDLGYVLQFQGQIDDEIDEYHNVIALNLNDAYIP